MCLLIVHQHWIKKSIHIIVDSSIKKKTLQPSSKAFSVLVVPFLDISSLDMIQINSNLRNKALQHEGTLFFTIPCFTTFWPRHTHKSKFQERDVSVQNLFFYFHFFASFLIFLLKWLTFFWACFQFKNYSTTRKKPNRERERNRVQNG